MFIKNQLIVYEIVNVVFYNGKDYQNEMWKGRNIYEISILERKWD